MSWAHKLAAMFRKSRLEREMDEELRFHLERQIEDGARRHTSCGAAPGSPGRIVTRWPGAAAGVALSFLAMRPLASFLAFGISTSDPFSFAGVLALLVLNIFAAVFGPAYRATKIEPMEALRYE